MRILVLSNSGTGVYKFRKELIERLLPEYDIYVSFPQDDFTDAFEKMGCKYMETAVNRHGTNPVGDMKLFLQYQKLLKEVDPAVVLTYTIKPNIYGGIACRMLKKPYVANITGLGMALEQPGLLRRLALMLYRIGERQASCIFFQNSANMRFFYDAGIVRGHGRLLPGSGVNLQEFAYVEYPPEGVLRLLYIGRFLRDKGIYELLEAAEEITAAYANVEFLFIGFADEPSIQEKVDKAAENGSIRYLPFQTDIRPYIAQSHGVVLPSYHEGLSNVLLEAAAMGRPVIASNVPGCREAFEEGVTGFGVEPKNSMDLVEKMQAFIGLPNEKKAEMGRRARQKMEREFGREIVVEAYLDEIHKIVGDIA